MTSTSQFIDDQRAYDLRSQGMTQQPDRCYTTAAVLKVQQAKSWLAASRPSSARTSN